MVSKSYIMNFLYSSLETKKGIFKILLIGKLILLPILIISYGIIDNRPQNIFFHGDLIYYENYTNMSSIRNIGFIFIASIFRYLFENEVLKLFIYGLVALLIMCYVQSEILSIIFAEKKNSSKKIKLLSIFFSISNFYILIYSFKPGTDIYNCLGISILFCGLIKLKELEYGRRSLLWIVQLLIISLFRNSIFITILFLPFTKAKQIFLAEIRKYQISKRIFYLTFIALLFLLNFHQLINNIDLFISLQDEIGLKIDLLKFDSINELFIKITEIIKLIILKLFFLISARDSVSITSNWYVTNFDGETIFVNPYLSNILPAILLFSTNLIGLITIFYKFSKEFRKYFSYSLIALLPIISYYSHLRYFLPYCIFTSACLPFILERKEINE